MSRTQDNTDNPRFESASENLEAMLRRISPFIRRPKVTSTLPKAPWHSSSDMTERARPVIDNIAR